MHGVLVIGWWCIIDTWTYGAGFHALLLRWTESELILGVYVWRLGRFTGVTSMFMSYVINEKKG